MKYEDWQIITLDKVTSTNDAVNNYCDKAGRFIALRAVEQTAGRGRRGRIWQSLKGNLFLSLAFEYDLQNLGNLVIAASLSLCQTIKSYSPSPEVKIKWPNDILLNNAKVSGMLLEKGIGNYIIIGIGVNIVHSPDSQHILYPATSLTEAGITTTAAEFTENYLQQFSYYVNMLQNNKQAAWQMWTDNAKGIGSKIEVLQENKKKQGIFSGIDENGSLLLDTADGREKVLVGDVFYIEKVNDGI